ncbi:hypothetical protein J3D49_004237 [Pseudomonas kilonensis]|nr:hypothetical protein [Pseudomonas kilonensis]
MNGSVFYRGLTPISSQDAHGALEIDLFHGHINNLTHALAP